MKLVRFLSTVMPLCALPGLVVAGGSDEKLVPVTSPGGRTPVTTTPAAAGGASQALVATCLPAIRDQSGPGCIQASSVPTYGDLLPLSDYFNVTPAAEVGIGTASPEATLHMLAQTGYASTIMDGPSGTRHRYRQGGTPTWDIYAGTNGYAISRFGIDFPFIIDNATANTQMNVGAGNVGIGTATPTEKLDVAGNVKLRTGDRVYFGSPTENGDPLYFQRANGAFNESVLFLQMGDDSTATFPRDRFEIYNGQEVLLRVQSNGACENKTGAWTILSDRRMKRNIEPLQGALEKLLELQGVTYEYIDPTAAGAASGVRMGFVAQDVEAVFPGWVDTREDGTKTLTIQGFEALAVESLREVRSEKDAEVAELRAENAELRQRVEWLESARSELTSLKATVATLIENR